MGIVKDVLDFSGSRLVEQFQKAANQGRNIKDLVSHGNSLRERHLMA